MERRALPVAPGPALWSWGEEEVAGCTGVKPGYQEPSHQPPGRCLEASMEEQREKMRNGEAIEATLT